MSDEKRIFYYNVTLLCHGLEKKEWLIKSDYNYDTDNRRFVAKTTTNKIVEIFLGEHDTLVIEET